MGEDSAARGHVRAISPRSRLEIRSIAEIDAAVAAAGPRRFVVQDVILAGAHGVSGGVPKSGKGFDIADLAVSVASGTDWLGRFPTTGGVALLFIGEEDEFEIHRRLDAIAAARDLDHRDLPIFCAFTTPRLAVQADMDAIGIALERYGPALVAIDPMYHALGGADSSSLFEMGDRLAEVAAMTREAGASLVAVWHYNRNERARGVDRFTGAGSQEWGRFLIGCDVKKRRRTSDGGTELIRRLEVRGASIADLEVTVRRRVRALEPADPGSRLLYEVEIIGDAGTQGEPEGAVANRALELVREKPGAFTKTELARRVGGQKQAALEEVGNLLRRGLIGPNQPRAKLRPVPDAGTEED